MPSGDKHDAGSGRRAQSAWSKSFAAVLLVFGLMFLSAAVFALANGRSRASGGVAAGVLLVVGGLVQWRRAWRPPKGEPVGFPPHNRLKLPFFCLCGLLGLVVAVVGATRTEWWLLALGAAEFAGSFYLAWLVHRDRRYWWLAAPMDRRWRRH